MDPYEENLKETLRIWESEMTQSPSITDKLASRLQKKINGFFPKQAHQAITEAIKLMVKTVLFGAEITAAPPIENATIKERDEKADDQIQVYANVATVSGFGTGAGGFLVSLADFPILLSLKIKFLQEAAGIYGYDISILKERIFILYVFQLAFSSRERRQQIYPILKDWDTYAVRYDAVQVPAGADTFDWQTFQQEYRDSIDLAKFFQMVPVIGAAVGAVANNKLMKKLGETAMNCYRLRYFQKE